MTVYLGQRFMEGESPLEPPRRMWGYGSTGASHKRDKSRPPEASLYAPAREDYRISKTTGAKRLGYPGTETPDDDYPSADGRDWLTIMGLVIRSRRRSR